MTKSIEMMLADGDFDKIAATYPRAPLKNDIFRAVAARPNGTIAEAEQEYKSAIIAESKARREAQNKAIDTMNAAYITAYPAIDLNKINAAFQYAWREGHSSGFSEVGSIMQELIYILEA